MASQRNGTDHSCDDSEEELREYASSPCYLSELDGDYMWAERAPTTLEWSAIREWRNEQRRRLTLLWQQLSARDRTLADQAILRHFDDERLIDAADTGIYWPLPGEFDSHPLFDRVLQCGGTVAIPVVVENDAPLEFWQWDRQTKMHARGPWNIPAPSKRRVIVPSVIIVPLLGFDAAGHRLGNGGGYFDRTLAALAPRPMTIGVGYESGRLETIHPQAHDVPLDVIVTEAGVTRHRLRGDQ